LGIGGFLGKSERLDLRKFIRVRGGDKKVLEPRSLCHLLREIKFIEVIFLL